MTALDQLDDPSALRILSAVTAELHAQSDGSAIASMDDAREVIAALFEQAGIDQVPDLDSAGGDQARALLTILAEDPATKESVSEFVANPPDDEQRSVAVVVAAAVVLGGLVTWLQTKIDLDVSHVDGKTSIKLRVKKGSADTSLIKDIAKAVAQLF